jgi:hypothetical protein
MTSDALFDEPAGLLRLTEELAQRVLAPVLELGAEDRAALADAGLLPGGELHERLARARAVAGDALKTVSISRLGGEARGWRSAGDLGLTVHRGDGWADIVCTPPDFFADTVARLADLGPRPTADASGTPGTVTARCTVTVAEVAADGTAGERVSLDILDADDGMWIVRGPSAAGAQPEPICTEDLWRALAGMVGA